jgi:hypothetical protein
MKNSKGLPGDKPAVIALSGDNSISDSVPFEFPVETGPLFYQATK